MQNSQYVDDLIGSIVDEVKALRLYEDTTIVFWSDHGYKLGEHCDWYKHDNYEDATRIITIIKPAAGLLTNPRPAGTVIEQLVEEVDIYPTLVALHGDTPDVELQGRSFIPLLTASGATDPQVPTMILVL